ncbi:MAG: DUF4870 domain-containing protein [Flavobacteriales bacterium]
MTERTEDAYFPLPQPEDIPPKERDDAMGAYLMMFAVLGAGLPLPLLNLLAAIIYYFVHKDKPRFVRYHTLHSLFAQIPVTLLNAGLILWVVYGFVYGANFDKVFFGYMGAVFFADLLYFIFSLIAAFKARQGRFYYFVFFGRLAFDQVYRKRKPRNVKAVNRPPG